MDLNTFIEVGWIDQSQERHVVQDEQEDCEVVSD
jgi:hypothetical protein